jgi:hypothetical protein
MRDGVFGSFCAIFLGAFEIFFSNFRIIQIFRWLSLFTPPKLG